MENSEINSKYIPLDNNNDDINITNENKANNEKYVKFEDNRELLNVSYPSDEAIDQRLVGNTLRGTIFVIMNSSLGAGILALPLTFYRNGIVVGFITIMIVGIISTFSSYYIQIGAHATNSDTLGGIADKLWGKKFRIIVDITQLLLNFGFLVAYVKIINDQIPHVTEYFTGWRPTEFVFLYNYNS